MIDIEILHPADKVRSSAKAKIDTGADLTVIPERIRKQLKLFPGGTIPCGGFSGDSDDYPTYYVDISIANTFLFKKIKVISLVRENVLLGRDVINQIELQADGRSQDFSLTR